MLPVVVALPKLRLAIVAEAARSSEVEAMPLTVSPVPELVKVHNPEMVSF